MLVLTKQRYLHFISGSIFILLAFITLREFLLGNSIFIHRDLFWPSDLNDLIFQVYYTFDLDYARRILYLGPFLSAAQLVGMDSLTVEKISFLLTRFFIGFFAYAAAYAFLSSKINNANRYAVFFCSLFAGFIYAYNPFVTTHASTTLGFAFAYALIPLIFYFFDKSLTTRGFLNIFIASILISLALASSAQFLVILPVFLLLPWTIIVCLRKRKEGLSLALRNFVFVTIFSILISSYWIIPSMLMSFEGKVPHPDYLLTSLMLDEFSGETTFTNIFRLLGDWWPRVPLEPSGNTFGWTILTFLVPISIILSILFSRKLKLGSYIIPLSLISLLVIFFHKGSQPPFPDFYIMLYDLPIVGWMFRVPSRIGLILPFFFTMIITFGLYDLFNSRLHKLKQYLKHAIPIGLILSVSIISWPMFTGNFGGIYQDIENFDNIISGAEEGEGIPDIRIAKTSTALIGSSSLIDVLSDSEVIDPNEIPVIVTNDDLSILKSATSQTQSIILENAEELPFYFLDSKSIIVSPFTATRNHDPSNIWSVARSDDPLHGSLHGILQRFDIMDRYYDYGKGVVLTYGKDTLGMPIEVPQSDSYYLYLRYLENHSGGRIDVALDENVINVATKSSQNEFKWRNLGIFDLSKGKYSLTLENVNGLNVINLLVLIPTDTYSALNEQVHNFIENRRIIQPFDNPYLQIEGRAIHSNIISLDKNGSFSETVNIQLMNPFEADQVSLQFQALGSPNLSSSYEIKDFGIESVNQDSAFESNFENTIDAKKWSTSSGFLSMSDESKEPISGDKSLRVNIGKGIDSAWQVIATELIPTSGNIDSNIQLTVSATDTSSLHLKARQYDKNLNSLSTDTLFLLPSSSDKQFFETSFKSLPETKYVSLEFWVHPNPDKISSFVIDDVSMQLIIPETNIDDYQIFENLNLQDQEVIVADDSMRVQIDDQENQDEWKIIKTRPISIIGNFPLSYQFSIDAHNIEKFQAIVTYYTSDNFEQNVYKINESDPDGSVELLSELTSITDIDLLKTSKYTIATRVLTCAECGSMEIRIGPVKKTFSLDIADTQRFQWRYFTTDLSEGEAALKIHLEKTYLDQIIIYSDSYEGETLNDLFAPVDDATITAIDKIDPTKYEIKIDASEPFMLLFDNDFGLWSATVNGYEHDSIMAQPKTNVFFIEDTGTVDVLIEYKPQRWFLWGSIITAVIIFGSTIYLIFQRWDNIVVLFSKLRLIRNRKIMAKDDIR